MGSKAGAPAHWGPRWGIDAPAHGGASGGPCAPVNWGADGGIHLHMGGQARGYIYTWGGEVGDCTCT